ncbi:MAG: 30S ribosomal protein S8e [Candidatus Aenigmatarchaeota archaeon]|nr:MAG: 30S ribosomal protein S8e [Candidatus Aenigmarchaeota archaeon]
MRWQVARGRRSTGAKIRQHRKRRKHEMGRDIPETHVGDKRIKKTRVRGGGFKFRVLSTDVVNLIGVGLVKVKGVLKNEANPHYVRRNIITKGAIIETEKGKAKVTSRPGQDGIVNAVPVED